MIIQTVHPPTTYPARWWTGWVGTAEIHLVPIDDCWPHYQDFCCCQPEMELGEAALIVSHNSFDRRELTEGQQ